MSRRDWAQNLQQFRWDEPEVNEWLAKIIKRAYREVAEKAEPTGLRGA